MKTSTCKTTTFVALLAMTVATKVGAAPGGTNAAFFRVKEKAERDVLELATAVEQAFDARCDLGTLHGCVGANYDACASAFPNPICLAPSDSGDLYQRDDQCGVTTTNGQTATESECGAVWDFTVSSVTFPPSPPPSTNTMTTMDPDVAESVSFSHDLDAFFIEKTITDHFYWVEHGMVAAPWMYFGATTGVTRMYPARAQEFCNSDAGAYDPREQPWYVAASSGPKNVLLLLDTSYSMEGSRLDALKDAADRVIDTLTAGDSIAIVPFHTAAYELDMENSKTLMAVTPDIKDVLKAGVRDLEAGGSTNIIGAFGRAFDILEEASNQVDNCNTAIVILTDGAMTDPPDVSEAAVLQFVEVGLSLAEEALGHPVHLLTYSIPHTNENDDHHSLPSDLACITPHGVWTKLEDTARIVDSLSSYHKVFGVGLGCEANRDFIAWTLPYYFSTNGVQGVSVSAPVFDRSSQPPKQIGVVALDLPLSVLSRALGVPHGTTETIEQISFWLSSTAQCPHLHRTPCELEHFRASGFAGDEALCNPGSCPVVAEVSRMCDAPTNLVANTGHETSSFYERACCSADDHTPPAPTSSKNSPTPLAPSMAPSLEISMPTDEEDSSDDPNIDFPNEDSKDKGDDDIVGILFDDDKTPGGTLDDDKTPDGTLDDDDDKPNEDDDSTPGGILDDDSTTDDANKGEDDDKNGPIVDDDSTPGDPLLDDDKTETGDDSTPDGKLDDDDDKPNEYYFETPGGILENTDNATETGADDDSNGSGGGPDVATPFPDNSPNYTDSTAAPTFLVDHDMPTYSPGSPSGAPITVAPTQSPTPPGATSSTNSPSKNYTVSGDYPVFANETISPRTVSNETLDTNSTATMGNETIGVNNATNVTGDPSMDNSTFTPQNITTEVLEKPAEDKGRSNAPLIWAGIIPFVVVGVSGLILLTIFGRNNGVDGADNLV